jgi:hypothetical protein
MDYYPQPRPVLYGTSGEEAPPQTQTAPVRTGPPRYPPAPPLAGDAPEPFPQPTRTFMTVHERAAIPLALLYAIASVLSVLQVMLGVTGFANPAVGPFVLSGEILMSVIVIAALARLGGREYLLARHAPRREYLVALVLVALQVSLGIVFAQWRSPALWVATTVMLYLLRPSMMRRYGRRGFFEFRPDYGRFGSRRPIDRTHSWLSYVSEQDILRPGQAVRIIDGPFEDFEGIIGTMDHETGKVLVRVSMLGRETPVEVDFSQVVRLV